MTGPLSIRELRVYRLSIPLRFRFDHAAARRDTADPVVVTVAARAPYAHLVGCGETLARPYVTGESADSVVTDVVDVYREHLASLEADTFIEALEAIDALPGEADGRIVTAARAAVELALLDLALKVFERRPADVVGWLDLPGFGAPGCRRSVRYSGQVVGRTRSKLKSLLRLQWWYGLRDFKLKVGTPGWSERLGWAAEVLRVPIARRQATLRVDANAAWTLAEAAEVLPILERQGVCMVEQPLPDCHDDDLPYLAEQTNCGVMVDESLLTMDDAERLIRGGGVRAFNVRLAKNGGFLPSLRIARMGLSAGLDVQLGCMVGETSILSAAGAAFLDTCPRVRFVEGAYGRWLLTRDVTRRLVRFGYGGRMGARRGAGFGVTVDTGLLDELAVERPRMVQT
jgi:muconate cycloisomerase